jgi:hypothetical protein
VGESAFTWRARNNRHAFGLNLKVTSRGVCNALKIAAVANAVGARIGFPARTLYPLCANADALCKTAMSDCAGRLHIRVRTRAALPPSGNPPLGCRAAPGGNFVRSNAVTDDGIASAAMLAMSADIVRHCDSSLSDAPN